MAIPKSSIREELARVVASPSFEASDRLRRFLCFIVEETLAGRAARLNQYAIATEVFGRSEGFDPIVDPIVRIDAGKLRRALERYYLTAGRQNRLQIEIPKGAYVPSFVEDGGARASDREVLPRIRVAGPRAWGTDSEVDEASFALSEELLMALTQLPNLRVVSDSTSVADYALEGTVRRHDGGMRVSVRLVECASGSYVWSDRMQLDRDPRSCDRAARTIAVRIGDLDGAIARQGSRQLAETAADSRTASLAFQYHLRTLTPESYLRARKTLETALDAQPRSAELCAMMADVLRGGFAHGICPDSERDDTALAFELAQEAVSLDPQAPLARLALGYGLLHRGENLSAGQEAVHVLESDLPSASVQGDAGLLLTLSGDDERGPDAAAEAIELLEYCPGWFHHALFLKEFRSGRYREAATHADRIHMPHLLWDSLDRAAALGMQGKVEAAESAFAELVRLRPDFPLRPRRYLDCFVPDKELIDHLLTGLMKAGLQVSSSA